MFRREITYIVQNSCPSLQSDTLEHGQHGETKIVEIGDAVIGTLPVVATHPRVVRVREEHITSIARWRV